MEVQGYNLSKVQSENQTGYQKISTKGASTNERTAEITVSDQKRDYFEGCVTQNGKNNVSWQPMYKLTN
jgi:hypothetical protein